MQNFSFGGTLLNFQVSVWFLLFANQARTVGEGLKSGKSFHLGSTLLIFKACAWYLLSRHVACS